MTEQRTILLRVRGQLARFSAEHPLIVPPVIYYELQQHPELATMLDRVQPSAPIPINPSNETRKNEQSWKDLSQKPQ